ncbi:MAG: SH3 domain-containing protein [Pseudomonadota bacterium]
MRRFLFAMALAAAAGPAVAQRLDVAIVPPCDEATSQAACTGAATVMGLDPNGDGFLAVRTGPGTNYRMIDKVYNGDRVGTISKRGRWWGIYYGNGRQGWVHGNWLGNHIP